ncbi:MAG: hypothetical protein COW90_07290 [Nitrospirae bacterium CG22_combo_CG10-13_8_21_14_all_44_11]|nr:MAG: hypothetical protein COW90_07290 [Nitrospirae bacterium CG22_combo_CG10-13_8_21_14_all_44_11]
MSKKSVILLFLLIISPALIYFLWPSDESRIKKLIKEGAAAVEKKEVDNLMSKVSFNYQDDRGMTYILIKKILESQFKTMSGIKIEYENLKIEVKEKLATAEFDLLVIATIGNQTGYIIGDLKTPARIKLFLEKERVSWLVIKTEGLSL